MTWIRQELAPSPHLLDPAETTKSAQRFYQHYQAALLERAIRDQMRAIEHEQAILAGMQNALDNIRNRNR